MESDFVTREELQRDYPNRFEHESALVRLENKLLWATIAIGGMAVLAMDSLELQILQLVNGGAN